ncbi:MAG: hypothetical protein ACHQT9_03635 [Candidatus Saccharimonadales bacterium]
MHHWQDIVLAIGSLLFSVALVPSIISKEKPAVWTSITTTLVLLTFAVVYASLKLWYATFTITINALFWTILAIQEMRLKQKR